MDPHKLLQEQLGTAKTPLRVVTDRERLLEAKALMERMDQKYRALKGNERRLVLENGRMHSTLTSIRSRLLFCFLPKWLKNEIRELTWK